MSGVLADASESAWTFGASVLSFAFPMILFVVVATALYVLYTKPEFVPGHWVVGAERPVSYTSRPGKPTTAREAPAAPVEAAAPTDTETTGTTAGESAGTGDAE
jgi:hypothetical protein